MTRFITSFIQNESGATAIEYAFIASLVSIAGIAGMTLMGNKTGASFNNVSNKL